VLEEGEPGAVGGAGADAGELEGDAVAAQAGGSHALDGEQGVGLQLDGLADEEEVELQGIAGREAARLGGPGR
jgi:hypothetical protein